jgi:RNA polymerase sigma-70 factor (ECF subfamily)
MRLAQAEVLQETVVPAIESGASFVRPTFDEVYESHFDYLFRSARALGIPAHAVDDVLQEVFLVVHRRLGEFEGRASVRTWLFRVLANVVREHRRRFRRKEGHEVALGSLPDGATVSPLDARLRGEAIDLLCSILDRLDDDKRTVFVLAELEEMPVPEIAVAIDENENTVYSRLRLARAEFERHARRLRSKDEWRLP